MRCSRTQCDGNRVLQHRARLASAGLLTLMAYREMDLFTPLTLDHHLERAWIEWDRAILHGAWTLEALGLFQLISNSATCWSTR